MKTALLVVLGVFVPVVMGAVVLARINNRPLTTEKAVAAINAVMQREAVGGKSPVVMMLVHSDALGLHETFVRAAVGDGGAVAGGSVSADTPFHIASVGKLFTATLIGMLADEGALSFDDSIARFLDPEDLDGLFVYRGVDHRGEVTVGQLLAHTSGVADYFGDKNRVGVTGADLALSEPDRFWTPNDLLDYTRAELVPVAAPGERFHYSDTGFVLLGLLVESVSGRQFHEVLHERIFDPLGMNDSYLLYRSEPVKPRRELAPIRFGGVEVSTFRSLSIDWAGGGIVSTLEDLLRFSQALHEGKLLSPETLAALSVMRNEFRTGIYYGMGMMEYRFEKFFFLLRGMPRLRGHVGILSTHLLFDPKSGMHVVVNFGSEEALSKSFKAVIRTTSILQRAR